MPSDPISTVLVDLFLSLKVSMSLLTRPRALDLQRDIWRQSWREVGGRECSFRLRNARDGLAGYGCRVVFPTARVSCAETQGNVAKVKVAVLRAREEKVSRCEIEISVPFGLQSGDRLRGLN
jgi:uncharacterized protein (DUF58 family)